MSAGKTTREKTEPLLKQPIWTKMRRDLLMCCRVDICCYVSMCNDTYCNSLLFQWLQPTQPRTQVEQFLNAVSEGTNATATLAKI